MSDADFNKLSLSDECFVDTPEHDIEKIKIDTIRRNKLQSVPTYNRYFVHFITDIENQLKWDSDVFYS